MEREKYALWIAVAAGGALMGLLGALAYRLLYSLWGLVYYGFSRSPSTAVAFPLMGLLASYLLVDTFSSNKYMGSATGIVLAEYHTKGSPSPRDSVTRALAGMATVGLGGAAGPEGLGILLGPGVMNGLSGLLGAKGERGKLTLAGAAAGLAGVLKTPATAILYALEVPFTRGLEKEPFLEVVLAATTSYAVSAMITGPMPLLAVHVEFIAGPMALLWSAILGLIAGAYSIGFSRLYTAAGRASSAARLRGGFMLTVLLGGLAIGLLGLAIRQSIGPGIDLLEEAALGGLVVTSLLILLLARSAAVAATLNFGGVGGLLTPTAVNGAILGALYAKLLGLEPVAFYALVGAAAALAGTYKLILAPAALVVELSGVGFMIPALLASAIAYTVSLPVTLFRFQLTGSVRGEALLRGIYSRLRGSALLSGLRVSDVMRKGVRALRLDDPLGEALDAMASEGLEETPVVDEGGRLVGRLVLEDVSWLGGGRLDAPISSAPLRSAPAIQLDAPLEEAIELMLGEGLDVIYVVDRSGALVGSLDSSTIVRRLIHQI